MSSIQYAQITEKELDAVLHDRYDVKEIANGIDNPMLFTVIFCYGLAINQYFVKNPKGEDLFFLIFGE